MESGTSLNHNLNGRIQILTPPDGNNLKPAFCSRRQLPRQLPKVGKLPDELNSKYDHRFRE